MHANQHVRVAELPAHDRHVLFGNRSRRGVVWSYTDAQYQPPAPYVAADPYVPFALAAVTLPEGLVVLGQVADGFGVADLRVGSEVELVVEPMSGLDGDKVVWRWRPVQEVAA